MKTKMKFALLTLAALLAFGVEKASAVDITLTIDEGVQRPAGLNAAEKNLAQLLTEINRAQEAGGELSVRAIQMNDFSKKSLARIWAVTPFFCADEEVVERCWIFKNGTMMVSHIPLIITPKDEKFGDGTFQEAVVEFDRNGSITDFRFSLSSQMGESMTKCGNVAEVEQQHIIQQQLERFRTAYNMKDAATIEAMFSDDALIITGTVVTRKAGGDNNKMTQKVQYTKQNKQQYIANLKRAFARNKWIDVKFYNIGENGEEKGNCGGITRSAVNPNMYGVRMRQSWKSSNYSDEGYLFLLWEFPTNGSDPIIHVRTWQPEWVGGKHQQPDDDISTLGGFDL